MTGNPTFIGRAQRVCMSTAAPPTCAPGATVYASPFNGWTADFSRIPSAAWIWAPGIDGTSTPADLATFFFSKAFRLHGDPANGALYVSADDFAAVHVNGSLVGTIGSITDPSIANTHLNLTAFDITAFLREGRNVITIEAQNGPAWFSGLCGICNYALNPAGVVFGGSIGVSRDEDVEDEAMPVAGNRHRTIMAGR
ncbi:MAG: hypothetical protein M3R70_01325 [Actinomycetota bacterium]|nr:hypothetical protein [Actinomycetota bacterium]